MKFIHSGETGYTHCWAEIPETQLMVDITADQFSASYDSVVIKNKDEHYNIHKLTGTLVCVNPFEELEVFQSFKHWAKDQIPTQRTVQDVLSFTLN